MSRFSLFEALELVSDQKSRHNIASEPHYLIDFTPLYRPRIMGCMSQVLVFTDAAGGNASELSNGAGTFCPPFDWSYMPRPALIRENRPNSLGIKFANKLCCLEGVAALIGLTTIPDRARNRGNYLLRQCCLYCHLQKKRSSCE